MQVRVLKPVNGITTPDAVQVHEVLCDLSGDGLGGEVEAGDFVVTGEVMVVATGNDATWHWKLFFGARMKDGDTDLTVSGGPLTTLDDGDVAGDTWEAEINYDGTELRLSLTGGAYDVQWAYYGQCVIIHPDFVPIEE